MTPFSTKPQKSIVIHSKMNNIVSKEIVYLFLPRYILTEKYTKARKSEKQIHSDQVKN